MALQRHRHREARRAAAAEHESLLCRGVTSAGDRSGTKLASSSVLGDASFLLKPGKAIQVSISDNRWIVDALDEPLVAQLNSFLASLLAAVGD